MKERPFPISSVFDITSRLDLGDTKEFGWTEHGQNLGWVEALTSLVEKLVANMGGAVVCL